MIDPIRTLNVSYRIGATPLLTGITTRLNAGAVHVLIGPNGAGKTTTLKVLSGDIVPTDGQVWLHDKPLAAYNKSELAFMRAVMPQDVLLSLAFTSEEVVMMGRFPHMSKPKLSRAWAADGVVNETDHDAVVAESMGLTETDHLRSRLYPTLSGGEQARVTMARVLAQRTPVVFLDEPTASLDPRHQHLVMRLARQLADQGGTVVAVLHDLNLASAYADNVILLGEGCIQAQGAPKEVFETDVLQQVFQTNFMVTEHPTLPGPLVLSLPHTDE